MHTLLIYFRAIALERALRAGAEKERERSLIGAETQLFRLSRDRNRIRRGSFRPRTGPSRDVIVTRHLSPSSVSSAALRAGDFFFCSALKPPEVTRGGRGEGRLSIGVARSNVADAISQIGSGGAPTVYKRFLFSFFVSLARNPAWIKDASRGTLL